MDSSATKRLCTAFLTTTKTRRVDANHTHLQDTAPSGPGHSRTQEDMVAAVERWIDLGTQTQHCMDRHMRVTSGPTRNHTDPRDTPPATKRQGAIRVHATSTVHQVSAKITKHARQAALPALPARSTSPDCTPPALSAGVATSVSCPWSSSPPPLPVVRPTPPGSRTLQRLVRSHYLHTRMPDWMTMPRGNRSPLYTVHYSPHHPDGLHTRTDPQDKVGRCRSRSTCHCHMGRCCCV